RNRHRGGPRLPWLRTRAAQEEFLNVSAQPWQASQRPPHGEAATPYCGAMFAPRMKAVHLASSDLTSAPNRPAGRCAAPMPAFSGAAFVSEAASPLAAATLSLLTIASGVRAGAHSPYQVV